MVHHRASRQSPHPCNPARVLGPGSLGHIMIPWARLTARSFRACGATFCSLGSRLHLLGVQPASASLGLLSQFLLIVSSVSSRHRDRPLPCLKQALVDTVVIPAAATERQRASREQEYCQSCKCDSFHSETLLISSRWCVFLTGRQAQNVQLPRSNQGKWSSGTVPASA